MNFRLANQRLRNIPFFIDNNPFEISQDYSYLGLSAWANGNFLNEVNEAVLARSHLQKLFRVLSETHAISLSESPLGGSICLECISSNLASQF